MKEHLNLNAVSVKTGWVDTPQTQERLNAKISTTQNRDELLPGSTKNENDVVVAEDRFERSSKGGFVFDDTAIDNMDFATAMEHVNFILAQANQPEGRILMSQAHHNIAPQQVMQMFGAM